MQHFLNANFKCRDQQVHGITFGILEKIIAAVSRHEIDVARMLTAAYTLAFYAMLRPTEYMLTPRHSTFDETRRMRACDVTFYKGTTRLTTTSNTRPDRYTIKSLVRQGIGNLWTLRGPQPSGSSIYTLGQWIGAPPAARVPRKKLGSETLMNFHGHHTIQRGEKKHGGMRTPFV